MWRSMRTHPVYKPSFRPYLLGGYKKSKRLEKSILGSLRISWRVNSSSLDPRELAVTSWRAINLATHPFNVTSHSSNVATHP
jgi:hypothetical protein